MKTLELHKITLYFNFIKKITIITNYIMVIIISMITIATVITCGAWFPSPSWRLYFLSNIFLREKSHFNIFRFNLNF